ncbi:hypothetical protein D7X33_24690 [Butyricicoccus sp. 1XD8-22]|nr:hypothetical protein D7X33_24690 [Butyricicoccus sp. 1XD8-22]
MVNQLNNNSQDIKEIHKKKRKSPAKPRKKELTLNDIKKQVAKMNTLSEYVLDKESNTVLTYYEVFDEKKIRQLLLELNDHYKYTTENNIDFFEHDGIVIHYLQFLIVKYFTKLHENLGSNFEENKEAYDYLDSSGLIWLFNEKIFDVEQLGKVYERFYERIDIVDKVIELPDDMKEKLTKLQNKDIIFNAFNKNKPKQIPEV